MILSIIRSKAVAIILGPTGTGFIGALQSSISLIHNVSNLGINSSAVRDISKANLLNNPEALSLTVKSLRKAVVFTGVLGLTLTLIFADFLSEFTFDTNKYSFEIRILSIALFFNTLQGGQTALIQGMRRIKDLAKMSIYSTLLGTIVSLPFIYFLKLDGVAYFLIAAAVGQYIISFYFARKIKIKDFKVSWIKAYQESKGMMKLGISFMGGSLIGAIVTYLIRVIIIRDLSLSAAGIYQAAFTISGIYIGVILQSMGKDFYPRLTGVAFQPKKEAQLINEQTQVGMILAAPGLMFTLALAPLGIQLLYSAEYLEAYTILQWMILGVFLRTISWPLGYFFVARVKGKIFFWTEAVTNILQFVLVFFGIKLFGLKGTGIAFFGTYIFYTLMMIGLLYKENKFQWSGEVIKRMLLLSIAFVMAFIATQYLPLFWGSTTSVLIGVVLSIFALKEIGKILEVKSLKKLLEIIKNRKK